MKKKIRKRFSQSDAHDTSIYCSIAHTFDWSIKKVHWLNSVGDSWSFLSTHFDKYTRTKKNRKKLTLNIHLANAIERLHRDSGLWKNGAKSRQTKEHPKNILSKAHTNTTGYLNLIASIIWPQCETLIIYILFYDFMDYFRHFSHTQTHTHMHAHKTDFDMTISLSRYLMHFVCLSVFTFNNYPGICMRTNLRKQIPNNNYYLYMQYFAIG